MTIRLLLPSSQQILIDLPNIPDKGFPPIKKSLKFPYFVFFLLSALFVYNATGMR